MADFLTPVDRSAQMRRIRKVDTKPELVVRRLVHAMGFRYRLHCSSLPGTPDIVLPRHRKVIAVHGCFWHQHEGCKLARRPKSRLDYWLPKLARNVERDHAARIALAEAGWASFTVWECQTRNVDALEKILRQFLARQPSARDEGT
ncbi:very short patch repair endonuclease [Methylosinus sp. RM1]|uniref:very short patch repair endonuclease n=1 Tax=Methylosinus sp. RM1 TaxID=2583817 RepID=UPI00140DF418|nr:DNA mismatch endonuclease Vsr [Methylosinus sp. RM1]